MKSKSQILAEAENRTPSDPTSDPPKVGNMEYDRADLIAALTPAANPRAVALLQGVTASSSATLIVTREHLLEALSGEAVSNADSHV